MDRRPPRHRAQLLLASLLLLACDGSDPAAPPEGGDAFVAVEIDPAPLPVAVGDTLRLAATLVGEDGTRVPASSLGTPTWSSAADDVASVSAQGVITGLSEGTSRITVTWEELEASHDLEVVAPASEIAGISADSLGGVVGGEVTDGVSVRLVDRAGRPVGAIVRFEALDGGTATPAQVRAGPDGTGRTHWTLGPRAGIQRLRITSGGGGDAVAGVGGRAGGAGVELILEAVVEPGAPASMSLAPADLALVVGESAELSATVMDAFDNPIPSPSIAWSSSDASVAAVDQAGTVEGRAPGDAEVTGTAGAASASVGVSVVMGSPASIAKVGGDGQTGVVGSPFGTPLQVRLRTDAGLPVPGVTVTWANAAGGGSATPASSTTDAQGRASTTWTAGSIAGEQRLRATGQGVGSVTFLADAHAGPPASATLGFDAVRLLLRGDTVRIPARVTDAYGNATETTIAWSSSELGVATVDGGGLVTARGPGTARVVLTSGGASDEVVVEVPPVPAVQDLEITDTDATTVDLRFTQVADGNGGAALYRVVYAEGDLAGTTPTAAAAGSCAGSVAGTTVGAPLTCRLEGLETETPHEFQVFAFRGVLGTSDVASPGSNVVGTTTGYLASGLSALSGDGQTGVAGAALAEPLVLKVVAGDGTPVPDVEVAWEVVSGGGSLEGGAPATAAGGGPAAAPGATDPVVTLTDGSGEARVTWTLGTGAGAQEARASVEGAGEQTFDATATPAAPATLTLSPAGDFTFLRRDATRALTATVEDAYGNAVTDPVTFESSDDGVATVTPAGLVTAVDAGSATISASIAGLTEAVEATIPAVTAVTDLALTHVGTGHVRIAFTEVEDGTGAPAWYDVRFVAGAGTVADFEAATRASAGTCAYPLEGTAVGATVSCRVDGLDEGTEHAVQVRAFRAPAGDDAITSALSGVVTGTTEYVPDGLSVDDATDEQEATVATTLAQDVAARVRASDGSPVPNVTIAWAVVSGGGSVTPSSSVTDASGRATASWTLGTDAGTQELEASATGLTPVTFTALADPAAPASVTLDPATTFTLVLPGDTRSLTATVRDVYGNVVSPATAPVDFSSDAEGVATVGASSGVVTAVAVGTATITAQVAGQSATVDAKVPAVGPVTALSIAARGPDYLELSLTEPDDGTGAAPRYEVRWTDGELDGSEGAFLGATEASAGTCASPVDGASVGGTFTCRVEGLDPSTQYVLQVRPLRGVPGSAAILGAVSPVARGCTLGITTVTPASRSVVGTGHEVTFSATSADCEGAVASPGYTWSSSNTGVATVDASTGVVTTRGAGTATITAAASCCGDGEATITVVAGAPGAWPNLPAGLTRQESADQSTQALWTSNRDWGETETREELSAPSGDGDVVALTMLNGMPDGDEPEVWEKDIQAAEATEFYAAYVLRIESPFQFPDQGAKWGVFPFEGPELDEGNPTLGTNFFAQLVNAGATPREGPFRLQASFQGLDDDGDEVNNLFNNAAEAVDFVADRWYRIEWHVVMDDRDPADPSFNGSAGNGSIKAWVSEWNGTGWSDPSVQLDYSGLTFNREYDGVAGAPFFHTVKIDWTWGGGAGDLTQDNVLLFDHIFVAW